MKAATTLTAPVISVRDETLIHRRFQHICRHFFSLSPFSPPFLSGSVAAWHCLLVSVSVCVCVCAHTDGVGWQGSRFAGPPRSIKRNKAGGEGAVPSPLKSKTRFGIGICSKRLDPFCWCRGSLGANGRRRRGVKNNNQVHHGVWGRGRLRALAEASACSIPPRSSPLKSACFCSLHNLIWYLKG